ncbi:patatin-like phospholipase family protein [Halomonas denitrificans]|nr:patatin-like phospholipase family protein [Halomonas denitrificans]
MDPETRPRTLSLVLGAGGARGLAHIGAIRAFEEAGYEIRSIAGCSMGALVGGMYAAGKLDVYTEWATSLQQSDVFRLVDWTLSGGGLIRGDRIIRRLREMVGDTDIESLPIDFTAIAVDIEHGKEIWLDHGSLFEAIRSSIAIPGLFTPHRHRGRLLVDGGILNPIPVAPTLRCLTDSTFVVNCNGRPRGTPERATRTRGGERGSKAAATPDDDGMMGRMRRFFSGLTDRDDEPEPDSPGLVAVLIKSLETMESVITRQHLAVFHPDLVVEIPRDACMIHEFHRAGELIELGRERTRVTLEALAATGAAPAR